MKKPPRQFFGANGVFMTGGGIGGEISGPIEVMFAGLIGGIAGLVDSVFIDCDFDLVGQITLNFLTIFHFK